MKTSNDPNDRHLHSMFTFPILFHSSKTLSVAVCVKKSNPTEKLKIQVGLNPSGACKTFKPCRLV
jgi:hypothetical protein